AAPAEEEEAEEAEETEETEEAAEEGYRITFTASEGGKVAFAPEAGAEAELKESLEQRIETASDLKDVIAVADEGYAFKGWMYKGEKFHEGETFTWANVPMLEDSGFVAAFVKTYYEETTESGVTVSVTAPVGAFPEGTVMKVRDIEADDGVLDAVKSAVADGSVVRKVQAVDISFWAGGVEIEPNGKIQVKITSDLIREASTPQIVHVPDAEDADSEAKVMATDPVAENSDEMSFESDRFSTYVVAEVLETEHIDAFGNVYDVIVTYTEEAKIPANSKVVVKEYAEDTDEYISAREKVIADKKAKGEETDPETLNLAVLDISIEGPDGAKIEPGESVHVDLKIKSLPEVDDLAKVTGTIEVRHLNERSGEVETVASAGEVEIKDSAAAAEFDIDSFSTFTLTWGDDGEATIHYGYIKNGSFEEFDQEKVAILDTTAASVSVANNFDGAFFLGVDYSETEGYSESAITVDQNLYKTETGWEVVHYTEDGEEERIPVAAGSHIYVCYTEQGSGGQSGGSVDPDVPSPTTTKTVTDNGDGTYTIQLDVEPSEVTDDESHYANVLIVLDATTSMRQNNKWTYAKQAVNALIVALCEGDNEGNNGKIDFSLVTFGPTAQIRTGSWGTTWTKDNAAFKAWCASDSLAINTVTGTNWEAGLWKGYDALTQRPDNDPTYVIFLT
ncbi:MAG: VWA domain-containing protein, partial [Bacteroidales bacterium]|nr:VWA domain-containing protein [Bacteroidales bacterium]